MAPFPSVADKAAINPVKERSTLIARHRPYAMYRRYATDIAVKLNVERAAVVILARNLNRYSRVIFGGFVR